MDTETPIARAVRILGGQNAAARELKCSQPSVFDWVRKGRITPEFVIPMDRATAAKGDRVACHELRPDLYPEGFDPGPLPVVDAAASTGAQGAR